MKIEYVARSYHLDEQLRKYSEDKLKKVLKFLEEPVEVQVELSTEKHRAIADVHVSHPHGKLQASEAAEQMADAINMAVDKVATQAQKTRKKFMDKRRRAQRETSNGHQWPIDVLTRDSVKSGQPRVIKSSLLQIKPMSIDEAAMQLEDSKHEFVVFRDSETDKVSVLYKRRDENYGLIAPEL